MHLTAIQTFSEFRTFFHVPTVFKAINLCIEWYLRSIFDNIILSYVYLSVYKSLKHFTSCIFVTYFVFLPTFVNGILLPEKPTSVFSIPQSIFKVNIQLYVFNLFLNPIWSTCGLRLFFRLLWKNFYLTYSIFHYRPSLQNQPAFFKILDQYWR